MKPVQLIAVFAENKPGQLARAAKVLAHAGANIRCITFATSDRFGVMKLLVDKTDPAFRALKAQGWTVSRLDVLAVEAQDKPGGLHAVAECLTQNDINIENASGFVSNGRAVLLLEVGDVVAAGAVLAAEGHHLLSREELLTI